MRLWERPFSGLVGEADPPPICLHPSSGVAVICPFFKNKVFSKPIGFLEKNWGVFSILEGSPFNRFLQRFPEEAPELPANFLLGLPQDLDCLSCPISLGISALVDWLSDHMTACLTVLLWDNSLRIGLWVHFVVPLWQRGSECFGGTDSLLHVTFQEVCISTSAFIIKWKRRFRRDAFLIYDRVYSVAIFSCVMRLGENKIEVIEEFVSNFLWFFYYRLTLSLSDFAKCRTR